MNDSKDHKAAAEPPLDCRVGQRIKRYLRQLEPHQNEREEPKLLRDADDEIERNLAGLGDLARYAIGKDAEIERLRKVLIDSRRAVDQARDHFLAGTEEDGWTLCALRLALDSIDEGLDESRSE